MWWDLDEGKIPEIDRYTLYPKILPGITAGNATHGQKGCYVPCLDLGVVKGMNTVGQLLKKRLNVISQHDWPCHMGEIFVTGREHLTKIEQKPNWRLQKLAFFAPIGPSAGWLILARKREFLKRLENIWWKYRDCSAQLCECEKRWTNTNHQPLPHLESRIFIFGLS